MNSFNVQSSQTQVAKTVSMVIADSDIKALLRACKNPQTSSSSLVALGLPLPPPYFELLSGTGIILESSAREEVEKRVICDGDDAQSRTSIIQLSSELALETRTIEKLLPYHREGWGRIGGSAIVTTGEFKRLREDLIRELDNQVVRVVDFCRRNEIDGDLFRKLLPPIAVAGTTAEGSWQWLGHDRTWVVGTAFCEARERDVRESLIDEKRPIEISTILADSELPPIFLTRLVSALVKSQVLEGTIEEGYYTPRAYVIQRQASIVDELRRDGLIATETLRKEGVENPEQFIRDKLPSARLLGEHFATADFIANAGGLVLDNVERQMWSDLKDLDLRLSAVGEKALRQVILSDLPELIGVAERIVSKDLESTLEEISRGFAVQRAEAIWKKKSEKDRTLDGPFKLQELLKHLSVTKPSLPMAILSHFVNTIHPRASSVFSAHLRELEVEETRAAKSIFVEKCYVRFHLHFTGLEALADVPLKTKLGGDLLEHSRSLVSTALEKLESALLQNNGNVMDLQQVRLILKTESPKPLLALQEIENGLVKLIQQDMAFELPTERDMENRKRGMLEEMQTQLLGTEDLSLMLLLVIVIIYSSKSSGVLKATGKYVPKLLKDLGKGLQIPETDLNDLISVKDAVIGKKKVEGAEADLLRRIASGFLGGG